MSGFSQGGKYLTPVDAPSYNISGAVFARLNSNYYQMLDPSGATALWLGGTGDPANYFDNSTHYFRARGGGPIYFGRFDSSGLAVGVSATAAQTLSLNGPNVSSGGILVSWNKADTPKWYEGFEGRIQGSTSDNLQFYSVAFGIVLTLNAANGNATFGAALTTTGAIVVNSGGITTISNVSTTWAGIFKNTSTTGSPLGIAVAGGPVGSDSTTTLTGFYDYQFTALVGSVTRSGTGVAFNTTSDEDLKDKFDESGIDWEKVLDNLWVGDFEFKAAPGVFELGVRAQQAAQFYPQAISYHANPGEGADVELPSTWSADYGRFSPLALWNLKRQKRLINDQADTIKAMADRQDVLEQTIAKLSARLDALAG